MQYTISSHISRVRSRRGGAQTGFTIVELLVVIVVIAILVVISIVVYNTIQRRALESLLKSDLRNGSKQLALFQVENGEYPEAADGLKKSDPTTLSYTRTGANSYCLTASGRGIAFHLQDGGGIKSGAIEDGPCPGHEVAGGDPESPFDSSACTLGQVGRPIVSRPRIEEKMYSGGPQYTAWIKARFPFKGTARFGGYVYFRNHTGLAAGSSVAVLVNGKWTTDPSLRALGTVDNIYGSSYLVEPERVFDQSVIINSKVPISADDIEIVGVGVTWLGNRFAGTGTNPHLDPEFVPSATTRYNPSWLAGSGPVWLGGYNDPAMCSFYWGERVVRTGAPATPGASYMPAGPVLFES